jgi:isocitrate lyase
MISVKPEPETGKRTYPHAELAKMFAPAEQIHPADKLRGLLRAKFGARLTNPDGCWLHTAGAYDALTASLLTDLGFEAVYAGGWQLAVARGMYPDLGLYPSHSMVDLVRELIRGIEGARDRHFFEHPGEVKGAPPVFADIESGFGGPAQTFALVRELIRAGAAGVHLEDQDSAQWIEKLIAVKAAAQAAGIPLVVIARTDAANGAAPGGRAPGIEHVLDRALEAAALGVDLIWPEFSDTSSESPQRFAEGVHKYHPEQMLAYNLSPSLHWGLAKREGRILTNRQLGRMGYALQFSSLLAFRTAGMALETWLKGFRHRGLDALADLQLVEVASLDGEPQTRLHQKFAGTDRWLRLEQIAKGVAP